MRKILLLIAWPTLLFSSISCAFTSENNEFRGVEAERLHKIFERDWEYLLQEFPESATFQGVPGQNHRWTDYSLETIQRRKDRVKNILKELAQIDRSELNSVDQLNFDLFLDNKEKALERQRFPEHLLPITQLSGIHQEAARVFVVMPTKTEKDYDNILARLKALPKALGQVVALMYRGVEQKITPPRITMRDIPDQVLNQIPQKPMESPLLISFKNIPDHFSEKIKKKLKHEARTVYREKIIPAFQKFHEFLVKTYLPACRDTVGLLALPNGEEWYDFRARAYTTTNLTADAIHQIGLSEVSRIRREMSKVIEKANFEGDFVAFCEFLRSDPQFYFEKEEDLLKEYRDICKRADAELVSLFGTLPRNQYGVIPVPAYSAKSQTTAYYQRGSIEAGRPGYFFANTYNLKSRPSWEMVALSLHEAVPGHHFQISIAQELEGLPNFRKNAGYTAFIEGWALYSESLGEEMGFYEDPYAKFGQLTYEMWRAIRLVVDTGIHSKGWTRQQAIDFFKENSPKPEHDIIVEVDRYIVWPGQALAYKMGELKIKELRRHAEEELGDQFSLRTFHDQILTQGALPLDILEKRTREWVRNHR